MPDTLENPTATEPVQAEPDLLPCPWCGTAENVRVDMGHYYGEVTCWNCKGAISWGPEKTTRAEAIAAWNTRHTSDLAERIEGLVADDIRYLCRFADWAAGQGFCQIKGLDDPEEWLCDFWSRHGPPSGDGYSADAVADAILAALKEEPHG